MLSFNKTTDNKTAVVSAGPCANWLNITPPFNDPLSRTTQVSRYLKGKTNLDFNWSKRQWVAVTSRQHPTPQFYTNRMPFCHPTNSVKALKAYHSIYGCISLQANNHAIFLQAICSSWHSTNSVKALKARTGKLLECCLFCFSLSPSSTKVYNNEVKCLKSMTANAKTDMQIQNIRYQCIILPTSFIPRDHLFILTNKINIIMPTQTLAVPVMKQQWSKSTAFSCALWR